MTDEGHGPDTSSIMLSVIQQLGRDCVRCLIEQELRVSRVVVHLLQFRCLADLLYSTRVRRLLFSSPHSTHNTFIPSEDRIIIPNMECTGRKSLERRDPSEAAIGSPLSSAVAWWLEMACVMAEGSRRPSLNSTLWSTHFALRVVHLRSLYGQW